MLTKKPSALVYNWSKLGVFNMRTSLYDIEHLWDDVVVYSLPFTGNHIEDYARYKPDLIVSIGLDINIPHYHLRNIHIEYPHSLPDNVLANDIVCNTVFKHCEVNNFKCLFMST